MVWFEWGRFQLGGVGREVRAFASWFVGGSFGYWRVGLWVLVLCIVSLD